MAEKILDEARLQTISELLLSKRYTIPSFQRPFSWTQEQYGQLWEDISSAFEKKEPQYFIGTMVFRNTREGTREVIDGQQRLWTITLMLIALRDTLKERGQLEQASKVLNEYLVRKEFTGEKLPIFNPPEDRFESWYLKHLRDGEELPPLPKRRGRPPRNLVKEAYEFMLQRLRETEELLEFAKFFTEKVICVAVVVTPEGDPFTIFEVLNTRGLELSVADLLKNKLLALAEKRKKSEDMRQIWSRIEATLRENDIDIAKFLRHFWLSNFEVVTQRKLYEKITRHLDQAEPFQFAEKLQTEAEFYNALLYPSPDDKWWADLVDFREMGISQHLPLLLAVKSKGAKEMLGDFIGLCDTMAVRYLIAAEGNPNILERKYSAWAIELRKKEKKDFPQVLAEIRKEAGEICPSDQEFEKNFEQLSELRGPVVKHLLRKIEEHVVGKVAAEEKPVGRIEVEIEHVMPRKESPEWPNYDREGVEKLGNLTLIGREYNRRIRNKRFQIKLEEFRKSAFEITRGLCKYKEWGIEEIEERQKWFASLAPKIWRF